VDELGRWRRSQGRRGAAGWREDERAVLGDDQVADAQLREGALEVFEVPASDQQQPQAAALQPAQGAQRGRRNGPGLGQGAVVVRRQRPKAGEPAV
jgi:hypothetical protein